MVETFISTEPRHQQGSPLRLATMALVVQRAPSPSFLIQQLLAEGLRC